MARRKQGRQDFLDKLEAWNLAHGRVAHPVVTEQDFQAPAALVANK